MSDVLPVPVTAWLAYLGQKGKSQSTLDNYRRALAHSDGSAPITRLRSTAPPDSVARTAPGGAVRAQFDPDQKCRRHAGDEESR